MPHISLEYSENLKHIDLPWVMFQINRTISDLNLFDENDIKTRAYPAKSYLIGLGESNVEQAFLSIKVELLCGRDPGVKEMMGQAVLRTLDACVDHAAGMTTQICVEVRDIPSELYFKSVKG